jgi:hypothetical protein
VEPLPPSIAEVTVPDCFSPSALPLSPSCALKLVTSSLRGNDWTERLASGPEAAVGTLVHRVLERSCREASTSAEAIFEQEYERIAANLSLDPRCQHFADLVSTKTATEWAQLRSWVLSRAERLRPTRPSAHRRPRGGSPDALIGAEIPLESRTLRLRGRADRVRKLAQSLFEIRDFKTGWTLDESGSVKPAIALQLQAYGLLLIEARSDIEVRLVVDDGLEREVAFDEHARDEAMEAVLRIITPLPLAGRAQAQELTTPGADCYGCSIRHVCPAYRTSAPSWWRAYPREIEWLSKDVWGTLVDVSIGANGVDVLLRDDAGRRVRIDGVHARHGISRAAVGSRLWFFGLEATGNASGFDGTRFHPRCFHELPRDALERRAWAAQVFME